MYYPYTAGANVKPFTSSTRLSAADLENRGGQPSDILVAVGQLLITGQINKLGYEQIVALGPVIAPKQAEPILEGHVTSLSTGLIYYEAEPRLFDGKETFSGAFFDLLDEPITLILDGKFTFADDVTPGSSRPKCADRLRRQAHRSPPPGADVANPGSPARRKITTPDEDE
jgi:hypothetical protein